MPKSTIFDEAGVKLGLSYVMIMEASICQTIFNMK